MLQDIPNIIPAEEIRKFCEQHRVVELALFGSALRSDFGPDSDIDVLVTFADEYQISLIDLLQMEDELAGILGREVDLVESKAVQESPNYIRKQAILDSMVVIHAG